MNTSPSRCRSSRARESADLGGAQALLGHQLLALAEQSLTCLDAAQSGHCGNALDVVGLQFLKPRNLLQLCQGFVILVHTRLRPATQALGNVTFHLY